MNHFFKVLAIQIVLVGMSTLIAEEVVVKIPTTIVERAQKAQQVFGMPQNKSNGLEMMRAAITEAENTVGKNNPYISEMHVAISVMYQYEEDFSKGLEAAEKAISCAKEFGDENNIQLLRAKISSGTCYLNLGDLKNAVLAYDDAVRGFSVIGDAEGLMHAMVLQGGGLSLLGDYQSAEKVYLKALELNSNSPSATSINLIKSLSALGSFYSEIGSFERALFYQKGALVVGERENGPNDPGITSMMSGIVRTYINLGEYTEAKKLIERMRQIIDETSGPHSARSASLSGLESALAAETGLYDQAYQKIEFLHKYRSSRGPLYYGVERVINNLGYLSILNNDLEKGEALLLKSKQLAASVEGNDSAFLANIYYNLAVLACAKKLPDEAAAHVTSAVGIYDSLIKAVSALPSDRQKLVFFQQLSSKTNFTITLSQKYYPENEAVRKAALLTILQRKGRAAELTRRQSFAKMSESTYKKRQSILAQIAKIAMGESRLSPDKAKEFSWKLQQQLEAIDRETSNVKEVEIEKNIIKNISAEMSSDEVLIEFVVYQPIEPSLPKSQRDSVPYHCAAFLLDSSGKIQAVELGEMSEIDSQIRAFRSGVVSTTSDDYKSAAKFLYEKVVLPIAQLVKGKKHWLISPDGSLNLIPFEALMDQKDGYLIDKLNISYLSNGRDLLKSSKSGQNYPPVIFAGPDYDMKEPGELNVRSSFKGREKMYFTALPGALAEGKALAEMMPKAEVKYQKDASENALKSIKSPLILHIATHGFFVSEEPHLEGSRGLKRKKTTPPPSQVIGSPRTSFFAVDSPLNRSGLALAGANHLGSDGEDGILTAMEVTGLNLDQTKLVVLSACETGIGEVVSGEGVYGLRRAFQLAGAESQVMSLWKVGDDATKELMIDFYLNLKKGLERGESLRLAKQKLMANPKFSHPVYWAAFILSGNHSKLTN